MKKHLKQQLRRLLTENWGVHLGVLVVIFSLAIYGFYSHYTSTEKLSSTQTHLKKAPSHVGNFSAPNITATHAIVWDVRRNTAIFEKNSEESYPLASLTKIMTAVTALERVPRNTTITIDDEALAQYGHSSLIEGERWLLADLLDFALIESSNDGIAAVASAVGAISEGLPSERGAGRVSFIDMMNEKAKKLGLEHMYFENESGLDIYNETEAGAYGSAEDVAKLFSYIITTHPHLLESTTYPSLHLSSLSGNNHTAINTNRAMASIPALIGSKTGYTDISGGNLGVVIDPGINYPIVIVVLGSTFEDRFSDVLALTRNTLRYFENSTATAETL